jgi:hypothetical protein
VPASTTNRWLLHSVSFEKRPLYLEADMSNVFLSRSG